MFAALFSYIKELLSGLGSLCLLLKEGEGPGEAQDGAKSGAPAAVAGFKPGEDPMETFVQALDE